MHTRLILTDIDGTVMPKGRSRVSERTVAAMRAAHAAGIRCGPASGRGYEWIAPFFGGDESCCSTCLATNGLQVYLDGERIHEEHQPHAALERVRAIVGEVPRAGLLCFNEGVPFLAAGSREDLARWFPAYAETCLELGAVSDFPVVKANVFADTDLEGTRELIALLAREVPELDFDVAFVGYANVMPHGYNKGSGVRLLCESLGIDVGDVVVFGDADNDLTMFSVVPDSVAVANATPAAARAARWHIGRCEEDAVAAAIERVVAGEWPFSA